MAKIKTKMNSKDYMRAAKQVEEMLTERNDAYTKGSFQYLRLVIHLVAAGQFIYSLYYWHFYVKILKPERMSQEEFEYLQEHDFGGKLKFLTFLNLILQAIYHSVALLNDCFGSNLVQLKSKLPWLRQFRDAFFAVLTFPIAFNVCLSFWVVYAYDRELIFPKAFDAFFPNPLNHVVHTNIALFAILDMFTCFRQYPVRDNGYLTTLGFMIVYVIWLCTTRFANGRWAYPIFDVLTVPLRELMLGGMMIFSVILYFVGEYINNQIWAPEMELLKRRVKLNEKDN